MVEASTGVNLWREWAKLEVADLRGENYTVARPREEYGAVILSLARQQWPDTSSYIDSEIKQHKHKEHLAGFVMRSSSNEKVELLLENYSTRFMNDFAASMPAKDSLR